MNFSKLAAGLSLALGLSVGANVQAVNMTVDGKGELAYFPYYSAQEGFATALSLTNTSQHTLIVKVQFREAENSRDVRDFYVILSPQDVWTASVTQAASGAAMVSTDDTSCTIPMLPDLGNGTRGIEFTNFAYTNNFADGGSTGLDRTLEGYVFAVELGASPSGMENIQGSIAYLAKHVNGVPRDCGAISWAWANVADRQRELYSQFIEPLNVLNADSWLVDAVSGSVANVEPTILANFYNPQAPAFLDGGNGSTTNPLQNRGDNLIRNPSDVDPVEFDVFPPVASFYDDHLADVRRVLPAVDNEDAVSMVLMRNSVSNNYMAGDGDLTDWVVTFPTKYHYVDGCYVWEAEPPRAPFENAFCDITDQGVVLNGSSPVRVTIGYTDYEEFSPSAPDNENQFSPYVPPTATPMSIDYEVNVVSVNGSNLLGDSSTLVTHTDYSAPAGDGLIGGWMTMNFTNAGVLTGTDVDTREAVVMAGLPVISFAVNQLDGTGLSTSKANYTRLYAVQ